MFGGIELINGAILYLYLSKDVVNANCGNRRCKSLGDFQKSCNTKTTFWQNAGYFDIDINGTKGPNEWGRDLFGFSIGNDGNLYPNGSKDFAIFNSCSKSIDESEFYWKNNNEPNDCKNFGYSCAGRIVEEDWKMTY